MAVPRLLTCWPAFQQVTRVRLCRPPRPPRPGALSLGPVRRVVPSAAGLSDPRGPGGLCRTPALRAGRCRPSCRAAPRGRGQLCRTSRPPGWALLLPPAAKGGRLDLSERGPGGPTSDRPESTAVPPPRPSKAPSTTAPASPTAPSPRPSKLPCAASMALEAQLCRSGGRQVLPCRVRGPSGCVVPEARQAWLCRSGGPSGLTVSRQRPGRSDRPAARREARPRRRLYCHARFSRPLGQGQALPSAPDSAAR